MLTAKELRKLIRAHNELSKIKVPRGATAEDMVKLIEAKNFVVDHVKKVIKPGVKRGKQITLKKAEELVPDAKKKTPAEKSEAKKKRHENVIKYIVKNKEVLEDSRVKELL